MSDGIIGTEGGGLSYAGLSWSSHFTNPEQAVDQSARTSTRIPVPSKYIGVLQPGDLIGKAGPYGEGWATKILRVIAGSGVVVVGAALAEDSVEHSLSKVKEKPCAFHKLHHELRVQETASGFTVVALWTLPSVHWQNFVGQVILSSVVPGAISDSWLYACGPDGPTPECESPGWGLQGVGEDATGSEAWFIAGLNTKKEAVGGFTITTKATAYLPDKDINGHPNCTKSLRQEAGTQYPYIGDKVVKSVHLMDVPAPPHI